MKYNELFNITCKKCGSNNVTVSGGTMEGTDVFQITCEECENNYCEEEY